GPGGGARSPRRPQTAAGERPLPSGRPAPSGRLRFPHAKLVGDLLAEDEFLYLAGRGERESGHEPYVLGHLEVRDLPPAVLADLLLGRLGALAHNDEGAELLAGLLVGHPDARD